MVFSQCSLQRWFAVVKSKRVFTNGNGVQCVQNRGTVAAVPTHEYGNSLFALGIQMDFVNCTSKSTVRIKQMTRRISNLRIRVHVLFVKDTDSKNDC